MMVRMETKTVVIGAVGILGVGALGYWGYRRWRASAPQIAAGPGTPATIAAPNTSISTHEVPDAPRDGCVVTALSSTAAYPFRSSVAESIVPTSAVVVPQGTALLVSGSGYSGRTPLLVATNRTTNQRLVLSWDPTLYRVDCSSAPVYLGA